MTLSCVKFDDIEFTEFERFDGAFRDIFVEDTKALSLELHESSFEAFHKVLEIIENIGASTLQKNSGVARISEGVGQSACFLFYKKP